MGYEYKATDVELSDGERLEIAYYGQYAGDKIIRIISHGDVVHSTFMTLAQAAKVMSAIADAVHSAVREGD